MWHDEYTFLFHSTLMESAKMEKHGALVIITTTLVIYYMVSYMLVVKQSYESVTYVRLHNLVLLHMVKCLEHT